MCIIAQDSYSIYTGREAQWINNQPFNSLCSSYMVSEMVTILWPNLSFASTSRALGRSIHDLCRGAMPYFFVADPIDPTTTVALIVSRHHGAPDWKFPSLDLGIKSGDLTLICDGSGAPSTRSLCLSWRWALSRQGGSPWTRECRTRWLVPSDWRSTQ
jgi:hypothetical protein